MYPEKVVSMSFSLKSIPLHDSFLKLGEHFLSEVKPMPLKQESKLIHFNQNAAIRDIFMQRNQFDLWAQKYQQRLKQETLSDKQRAIKMKHTQDFHLNGQTIFLLAVHPDFRNKIL